MAPLRSGRFSVASLRELLAKANEPKSGDALAGLAAASGEERVAAKRALADVPLRRSDRIAHDRCRRLDRLWPLAAFIVTSLQS